MAEISPPWGVTAAEVAALASHADLEHETTADPDFGTASTRRVSIEDAEKWLKNVAATVDLATRKRSTLNPTNQARVIAAAKTVVLNGAAAYLVDAAYPTRAGVNDNSYGAVLWNRYNTGLQALESNLEEWVTEGDQEETSAGPLKIAYSFPKPRFTEDMRW